MSYTNIPDAAVDLDSIVQEDWLEDLRDNVREVRRAPFGVDIAEVSTASATYVTVSGSLFYVRIPDLPSFTGQQRRITLTVQVKTTSGTLTVRLYDQQNATGGTEVTSTSSTYEDVELSIDVAAADAGNKLDFIIELKTSAGTASLQAPDHFTGEVSY